MGILKTYMFQGLIKIDSQACKNDDEVKKFVFECLDLVIDKDREETVQIRKVERINA